MEIDQVRLGGVRFEAALSALPVPTTDGAWVLDALRGLHGRLRAFVTDAAWVLDAEVELPVHGGRLDFGQVTVSHIGPDSVMGASHLGVYVDTPAGRQYLALFGSALPPGVAFEQRGGGLLGPRVRDRGGIDLPAFVAGVLQPRGGPLVRAAGPSWQALQRTRLEGELQLGDGALAGPGASLRLDGADRGRNRLLLRAAQAGHALSLELPALQGHDLVLERGGQRLTAASVEGRLSVRVEGLAGAAPRLAVTADPLVLRGMRAMPAG
ncbi:hypothetical protein [Aquabacterium sp. J223]|uniref:hypothetical protein n=1 Tax=Aquabacterium sp. J223 TaxID=2898431 RepID=UPI0021AD6031|nr:hypothetical protein [Aquabacterium sp. J223]UUX94338.1 hypothetical protein LRS07_13525 [Aquabacterium sp. J223]